jgi:uncharacterized protein YecT (DUF1311 family)
MNIATKSPSLFANFRFARFLFVSAACLSFPIASARAANPEATATPTPDPVEEKVNALRDKAKSTADMVEAEDEGVKLWDKELNRVYGELLQQLPKEDKSALKDSQQEWIKFRDRNLQLIQVVYGNAEGTMYHVFAARAALEVVKSRVLDLRSYLDVVETAWPSGTSEQ